jgi:competence protein ComFC
MKALDILLDLLYPKKCVFCGKTLGSGEEYFCRKCGEALPVREGAAETESVRGAKLCIVPLYYQDMVRASLLRYKIRRGAVLRAGLRGASDAVYRKAYAGKARRGDMGATQPETA